MTTSPKPSLQFWLVLLAVLAVLGLTLARLPALALTVGIASGAWWLLRGMALGGGMGNARQFGRGPADSSTRIGVCLAAAGIASAALARELFPLPFRIFYGVCLALACLGAVWLAWKRPAG